ncbi:tRNA (adenosine(37)-N6)-threonylcarbamoyltransferase complex dimerization subunit type 1 TsaB [Candidatus Saccharibacteria bacterium]|nr:tRNA (adenosine(37)-N6)-threonylcarbamoyltransferase complex dimerization subunit type 1 TsaB [Candidatus Saccharibacteria bacterium]
MLILALRTDKPEAEIGLYNDNQQLDYLTWQAHRHLAETIHTKIKHLLSFHGKNWGDIKGIVCYHGPGSFTGLRIGLTVANTLASSLPAAIVGSTNDQWLQLGINELLQGVDHKMILPEYGAPVHITQQRK